MSEQDHNEPDELDERIRGMEADGMPFPVREETLVKVWTKTTPVTTSAAFDQRARQLVEHSRTRRGAARSSPGHVLRSWREAVGLTLRDLVRVVHLQEDVFRDLEADAVLLETLPADFWRRYAAAVKQPVGAVVDLIASYDRARITTYGTAAARTTKELSAVQRAEFLIEHEPAQSEKLDEKRRILLDMLSH